MLAYIQTLLNEMTEDEKKLFSKLLSSPDVKMTEDELKRIQNMIHRLLEKAFINDDWKLAFILLDLKIFISFKFLAGGTG